MLLYCRILQIAVVVRAVQQQAVEVGVGLSPISIDKEVLRAAIAGVAAESLPLSLENVPMIMCKVMPIATKPSSWSRLYCLNRFH